MLAAHLADQMWPPLQQQDPAGHHGGEQVMAKEAAFLQDVEVGTDLRHLGNWLVGLRRPIQLRRRIDVERGHVEGVLGRVGVLPVEEAFLPLFDGLLQLQLG